MRSWSRIVNKNTSPSHEDGPYQKRDQCFVEVRRFGACEIASKMQEVENNITS